MRLLRAAILASAAACAVGDRDVVDTPTTPRPPARDLVELDFCNEIPEEPPWEYEEPPHEPAYDFPHCNNHGIATIEQVVAQTGLRGLELHDDWAGGFAVLAPLTELERLVVHDATANDLVSLRGLSKLSELSLHLTGRDELDITSLASLSRLRVLTLRMSHQAVLDLAPIGKLHELTSLRVDPAFETRLVHVDALRALASLRTLDIGVPLTERQVRTLPAVTTLSVLVDGKLSLRALARQSDVEQLSVSAGKISDFATVRRFIKLRRLIIEVQRGQLAISQLVGATGLEYLYIPVSAVRHDELEVLRAKRPTMIIELGYSPCDIAENKVLAPGERIGRAELAELHRTMGRCAE